MGFPFCRGGPMLYFETPMTKIKTTFFCQNCGAQSAKWMGKCSACNEWNTYVEEPIQKPTSREWEMGAGAAKRVAKPTLIHEIRMEEQARIQLADAELNRVLGGGLVPGSVVLFGGEPGIGKSTLLLQTALGLSPQKVLYISGEESEQQIKMRAERIGIHHTNGYILTETSTQLIFQQVRKLEPHLIVIDSIQTLHTAVIESSPGSISQIRECTSELMRYGKTTGTSLFIIGHINKEGAIAGPKVLEHMVDTVLQFEGDRNHIYRLLRATKNRFGSTNELGIYEMTGKGLRGVENPSEILVTNNGTGLSGISIAATIEGLRPMLVEVQALVGHSAYGTPQRSATGFDAKRLHMLLAVLEKRVGVKMGGKDVFLNLAGGIRANDTAMDLAVVCALLSSHADMPVDRTLCLAGEVGLSGEIRPVNRIDQRISEAQKLGYERMVISRYNKGTDQKDYTLELIRVGKVEEVFSHLFG